MDKKDNKDNKEEPTVKKRTVNTDKAKDEKDSKVVEDTKTTTKEKVKETTTPKVVRQQQVQPKNAFCIRLIGILIITIITFSIWTVFNDGVYTDPSYYIKEMPSPLLRHYQSGQMIPVFDKSTSTTFNLFIVQQGLDWDNTPRQHFVKSDESGTRYTSYHQETITGDDSSLETIQTNSNEFEVAILIHGQTTTSFAFRKALTYIQNERIHPIALDLPCFGFSDPLKNCSYHEIADRLDDILNSLQIRKPVHLVLYDTGAIIGTLFTSAHPNRVRSITYIDPVIDMSNNPLYYKIIETPFFNHLFLKSITSPLISTLRYKILNDRYQLFKSNTTQLDLDSYFYCLRYKNNIKSFIDTIVNSDTTFTQTYKLTTSLLSYNREKPIHLVITSPYIPTYQSKFFQQKFASTIRHTDNTQTFSAFFEDNAISISLQLADIVDEIDKSLRVEKPKPKPTPQQQQQQQAQGHSHKAGNSHGHSHSGNSHGHSHGANSHGHSHSGNSHGHSHGNEYGGHNYGL